ncbi:MAG: MCE family protein [Lentisphaeria bacterium]|nr:MCE family protein [Lentisphaeria bacterium]
MNEANKVKLGAFILISATLLIVAFISAGALRIFAPRLHAMTEVFTSVEGLTIGAPVKYLGMPVGKVTGMHMRGSDGRIVIYFDIFGEAFRDDFNPDNPDGFFDKKDLDKMVSQNVLSCLINASGLMGGSHLELVRNTQKKLLFKSPPPGNIPAGVTYIPSNPSHIGNAIQNVSRMLEELKSIDWNGFADKINGSLDNLNALMDKKEIEAILRKAERIGNSLEQTATRLEKIVTQENVDRINRALDNLNQSMQNLLKASTSQKVETTLDNLNVFLVAAKKIIDKTDYSAESVHSELKIFLGNLENSLVRLENNVLNITRTLQDFGRDPTQVLRGRREPEVD